MRVAMPLPSEHSSRLKSPDDFDPKTFRRTAGGTIYGRIKIPKTIGIIWGKLKGRAKPSDFPIPQALRFPIKNWTASEAQKFLKDNKIKHIEFEAAAPKKEDNSLDEIGIIDLEDENYFPREFAEEDDEYKESLELEYKDVEFEVKSTESGNESIINGEPGNYGIIKGYAATYNNKDRGGDTILPGAFTESLRRHKRAKRAIRMKYQHYTLIGGWPLSEAKDDEKGLFLVGEINLDVPEGKAAYALAKQGVLSDLSIGYSVIDEDRNDNNGTRKIKQVNLWEVSPVREPMNPKATITDVKDFKGSTGFKDLPLADAATAWKKSEAITRVREFTKSKDKPSAAYRKAFMWFDSKNADNFTAYKLPYADVIDGKLKAVPRAIFAVAVVLRGGRGGVDIPDADKQSIISHVKKYYKKMNRPSPFKSGLTLLDMDFMNKRDLETILSNSGLFTNMAATYVAKYFKPRPSQSESDASNLSGQSEFDKNKLKKLLVEIKSNINNL
jgi:HK97 family phage prohead protease